MQIQKTSRLLFSDLAAGGHSNKEYRLQMLADGERGAAVAAQYGRRGAALTSGYLTTGAGWSKTVVVMTFAQAQAAYDRKLNEKLSDGYIADAPSAPASLAPTEVSTASSGVENAGERPCELLTEIDERAALLLVESPDYWMQCKENGRRLEIRKRGSRVDGINRKGQIVALPPALAADAAKLPLSTFLIDGEAIGDGMAAFDLLEADSDLRALPYGRRFAALLGLLAVLDKPTVPCCIRPVESWFTAETKRDGLKWLHDIRAEGAVLKRIDALYRPGRNGQHFKNKFVKSCTCKVIAKAKKDAAKAHNSVALGLLNEGGDWVEVGHASAIGKTFLPADPLGVLAEVTYLYATEGGRLYQARITGIRPDVRETDCTMSQLIFKEDVKA